MVAAAKEKITVSEQVRQLWDTGMKVKDIAKELGIRYQFAYNVVKAYLQEQAIELQKKASAAAKQEIQLVQPPIQLTPQSEPQKLAAAKEIAPFGSTAIRWPEESQPVAQNNPASAKSVLDRIFKKN